MLSNIPAYSHALVPRKSREFLRQKDIWSDAQRGTGLILNSGKKWK